MYLTKVTLYILFNGSCGYGDALAHRHSLPPQILNRLVFEGGYDDTQAHRHTRNLCM